MTPENLREAKAVPGGHFPVSTAHLVTTPRNEAGLLSVAVCSPNTLPNTPQHFY